MSNLTWRTPADNPFDRALMQAFTCTTPRPPMGAPHPRLWEWEVQSTVRNRLLKDTARYEHLDQVVRLAEDDDGIAAVFAHARMKDWPPELGLPPGVPVRTLLILAIATRYRGAGGQLADRVMEEALYDILDREPDARRVVVLARIDHRNATSERLARRQGFELQDPGHPDRPLGLWYINLYRSEE